MKAPLPEVPALAPPELAKVAPLSLSVLCAVKALVAFLYLFLSPSVPDLPPFWYWVLNGVFFLLSWLLIYYLWRGYSVARGLWLWITVLILPFWFFPDESVKYSLAEQVLSWFDFGLSSLVYLNLPKVKAHFKTPKSLELS